MDTTNFVLLSLQLNKIKKDRAQDQASGIVMIAF
jgi:hypothetical protein